MPKSWHDWFEVCRIENEDKREFYQSVVAEKKPYFMRLIYPDLMRRYNSYIKTVNKSSMREFGIGIDELLHVDELDQTDRQREFIRHYKAKSPVGDGDCVMNKICKRFEEEFVGFLRKKNSSNNFDYRILKSEIEYSQSHYNQISRLYANYNKRVTDYLCFYRFERVETADFQIRLQEMKDSFFEECATVCPNRFALCNIILDLCYKKSFSKRFAWEMCGDEIIENLLTKNSRKISFPTMSDDGDISYCGNRFAVVEVELEDTFGDNT